MAHRPDRTPNTVLGLIWPSTALGLGVATSMWTAWYVLHLPLWGSTPPMSITGPLLILIQIAVILIAASRSGVSTVAGRIALGAMSGLIATIVTSLLFGMLLGETDEAGNALPGLQGVRDESGLIIAVYIALGLAMGAGAGWLSWLFSHTGLRGGGGGRWATDATGAMAWVNLLAMVPLVVAGGAVTSSGSGMAVPDWPGSFGANMFVFPFALLDEPRIFFEHTHRLFGTLVGLTALSVMLANIRDPYRGARGLSIALFLGVCVQGLFGAIRVTDINEGFGVVHGVLAQLLLCLAAITAVRLSRPFSMDPADAPDATRDAASRTLIWGLVTVGCVIFQLTLAAAYRHLHGLGALWGHVAFSAIAMVAVLVFASSLFRAEGFSEQGRSVRKIGSALMVVLALQMILGFAALGLGSGTFENRSVPLHDDPALAAAIDPGQVVIATVHQATGSGLLALTAVGAAWVIRLRRTEPSTSPQMA